MTQQKQSNFPFPSVRTAALLLVLLLPAQETPAQQNGKAFAMPVKAVEVKTSTVTTEVTAVGTLLANESVMIRPEIAGRVSGIHFDEGRAVTAGTKLITLDPAEYQARLEASRADINLNTLRYQRAQEMLSKNFISQEMADEARENLARSKALFQEIQAQLDKTEIRAPFSGIAGLRKISPGAYVKEGEDIVQLDDLSSLKVDFRVPEVYLPKIRNDQEVGIQIDAYPQQQFKGRVYAIEPGMDEKTRTLLLRARIPGGDGKLRAGMFARIRLVLDQRSKALIVPEEAIVPQGQDAFVFRIVDGKAALTRVQLGQRTPGAVEVVQGLTAGDRVVTEGQMKLKNGLPVMIMGGPATAEK